jgi:dTDP-4-dehydrorhamnose reductase
VDAAEGDPDQCFRVNAEAPGVLAEEAARLGVPLVHYSTDYVFDGLASIPYRETDPLAPINVYGESKAEGERRVAAANPAHLILRTSWIYDLRGRNFLRRILQLAHEREELRVVDDQVGAPTSARMVAAGTTTALLRLRDEGWPRNGFGVYHLTSTGATSWHGFAALALSLDPDRASQRCRALHPVPSSDFPTPARRPGYSVLDTGKFARRFGVALPMWDEELRSLIGEGTPSTPAHGAPTD